MATLQVKTEIHTLHSAKSLFVDTAARGARADDSWINGDRQSLWEQIRAFMGTTEVVRQRDGRLVEKKRRRDAKCLVVGTLSCPRANPRRAGSCLRGTPDCKRCCEYTADRLKQVVGAETAITLSLDDNFPRLRFYAAGNPRNILSALPALDLSPN